MNKNKTIYLHIGYNKTGTTAIQSTFYNNSKLLTENGLLYPANCMGKRKSPAHHSLAESILFRINKPLPKFVKSKTYNRYPDNYYWKLLHNEISLSDCDKIFISSEAFSRLRGHIVQMKFIKNLFEGFAVKILVYLRNQPEFLESAYNQAVKRGSETKTIDELMKTGWLNIDYFEELEQWASVFGHENIIMRIYDKEKLRKKGIVADVMKIIGYGDLTLQFKYPWFIKHWNIRLPNNMVETKRRINTRINKPRFVDNIINFWLHWAGKFKKDISLLTDEQIRVIQDRNFLPNNKLGEKYLDGEFPF
ncbi:MAG: hypothetical protein U9R19_08730 [Bacteroidota bacterium]|nr:hypothetical protein [Bacteroidota bacterium]